jgi:hypothetical protein
MTANAIRWVLLAIGIYFLLRTAWLDRRLQRFRSAGAPAAAYLGKFGRWRRDLYTSEGQPLIASTRRAFALFCIFSLLGVLILEVTRLRSQQ